MLEKMSIRWAIIVIVCLLGCVWISPNFVKYDPKDYDYYNDKAQIIMDSIQSLL